MNGFDFVLLAIRGRLAEGDLPAAERQRLELFLADYSRIAQAYRDRAAAKAPPARLAIHGRMPAELVTAATN